MNFIINSQVRTSVMKMGVITTIKGRPNGHGVMLDSQGDLYSTAGTFAACTHSRGGGKLLTDDKRPGGPDLSQGADPSASASILTKLHLSPTRSITCRANTSH